MVIVTVGTYKIHSPPGDVNHSSLNLLLDAATMIRDLILDTVTVLTLDTAMMVTYHECEGPENGSRLASCFESAFVNRFPVLRILLFYLQNPGSGRGFVLWVKLLRRQPRTRIPDAGKKTG